MGREIFESFFLDRFPGPGDRKDKAPATCRIGLVTVFDHGYVGLRAIRGIPTYNDQFGPAWRHKLTHHLAKQGIFAAIMGMTLGHNEAEAHGHAIAIPRRHHHHKAQSPKPGMMLAYTSFLH